MVYKSLMAAMVNGALLLTLFLVGSPAESSPQRPYVLGQERRAEQVDQAAAGDQASGEEACALPDGLLATNTITVSVTQLATSPALPGVIMATFDNSPTPSFSKNGGTCWQQFPTSPFSIVPYIAVAPRADGTIRFLGAVAEGPSYWEKLAKIYRTGDAGLTWAQQTVPNLKYCPPTSPAAVDVYQLIASPANPSRLYIRVFNDCSDEMAWYVDGFYVSSDGGANWKFAATTVVNSGLREIVPSPVLPERIYVRYGGTNWQRSDDGGDTWIGAGLYFSEMAPDSKDSKRLYGFVSSDSNNNGLDTGYRWIEASGDPPYRWAEQPCSAYHQLLAHPTISNTLLLRCDQGLYRSTNGGDHWEQVSTGSGGFLAADYGKPGRILWARDGGLWASDDAGTTWIALVPSWSQLVPCPTMSLPLIGR